MSRAAVWVVITLLAVAVLMLFIGWLRVATTRLAIHSGRLQIEAGIFHKRMRNYDIWRIQNAELDRHLLNRITGDGTLVLTLTIPVLPKSAAVGRKAGLTRSIAAQRSEWEDPNLRVIHVVGLARGEALKELYQAFLNLAFLMRGNPILKGIVQ
jgi:membrane protein YdbS with pleckstrin-like domain